LSKATIDFMGIEPAHHVAAPTRAFLDDGRSLEVTLPSGTRLRHERHYSWTDVCSQTYMDFDAFLVMTGQYAGRLVFIEDASTPRDQNAARGFGPHLGPRPQLGLPASVVDTPSWLSID
jgi:hypothetical protein